MTWEVCTRSVGHRSLAAAQAVATWLNSQNEGRGRFRYRAATQPDGSHRVERTARVVPEVTARVGDRTE
jgi:hypothetical protein